MEAVYVRMKGESPTHVKVEPEKYSLYLSTQKTGVYQLNQQKNGFDMLRFMDSKEMVWAGQPVLLTLQDGRKLWVARPLSESGFIQLAHFTKLLEHGPLDSYQKYRAVGKTTYSQVQGNSIVQIEPVYKDSIVLARPDNLVWRGRRYPVLIGKGKQGFLLPEYFKKEAGLSGPETQQESCSWFWPFLVGLIMGSMKSEDKNKKS